MQTAGHGLFFSSRSRERPSSTRENFARDRRQSFDNAIKEGVPVTRDEKTILFGRAAARPRPGLLASKSEEHAITNLDGETKLRHLIARPGSLRILAH